ncbi:MAG: hypothetical protein LC107_01440 [Chitinophagales bacterium]|nr:hypothetical protein [Chitinophagales bacterium]
MKWTIFLLSALLVFSSFSIYSLDDVRANYSQLATDKELCSELLAQLEKNKNQSATHLAYLGSLQTIWANHTLNPATKLSTFNKGKKNIEAAIKKEPKNAELRFIRLSVQKNAPAFLGYQSNIKEDIEFIKNNRSQIKSNVLNRYIEPLLKEKQ